jgi:two-component system, OmpR family, catabolic regulation response regulator CreB
MAMQQLLLLEDDPAIAAAVVFAFERDGYRITHCSLVQDARAQWESQRPDAMILDIGLPDGSGLDLCRDIRRVSNTPILMLSARGEELDRILGLELGADDYLAKPFSPRELVARVRALLRRSTAAPEKAAAANSPDLVVDFAGQRVQLRGKPLELTRRELGLLTKLLETPGRIYTRDTLLNAVWGMNADSTDRTVDTHIKTLRAKLRALDDSREYIHTHRGMGYSLTLHPTKP